MNFLTSIWSKIRHGLVLQVVTDQLIHIGIDLKPYYWVREGLFGVSPSLGDNFREYSCGFFGPNEMRMIAKEVVWISESQTLQMLDDGKKCFGIKRDGEIAAFNWFEFDACDLGPLESNQAYLFDMYTMKHFRGCGLAPYLRYKSYEVLQEMGRDMLFSKSDCFNSSSIKFKKKLGARFVSLVVHLHLFNKFERHWLLREYPE